jgi:hypothetical protein
METIKDEEKFKVLFYGFISLGVFFLILIILFLWITYTGIIKDGFHLYIIEDQYLLFTCLVACFNVGLLAYFTGKSYKFYNEMKKINKKEGEK